MRKLIYEGLDMPDISCAQTIDMIIKALTITIGAAASSIALLTWKQSIKTKRAEFINQIIEKIRFNKEFSKAVYYIDYEQNWYNANYHGSELEPKIDMVLSYFSYICYLRETRLISKKELDIFEYWLKRLCDSQSIQLYLWNIYHFSNARKSPCSFKSLIDYGLDNGFLPKGLTDPNFVEFKNKRYLNF